MMTNCGCREISRTPIEFNIEDHPQVHINCGPILPNTNDCDLDILQNKIICDFQKVIKQLECGIQPDIETILEGISLIFMNSCGYNVAKKMYSTDIEEDYFLRHNNFLSEFETQEERDQVLLNLGIYDKMRDMITKQEVNIIIDNTTSEINSEIESIVNELNRSLDTKIGYVKLLGNNKWYCGFASEEHFGLWLQKGKDDLNDPLILGKWIASNYVPKVFTIMFNTLGGDYTSSIDVNEGFSFEFPRPTHSNPIYNFGGWYTEYDSETEQLSGNHYNAGDRFIPENNMIFFAKWNTQPITLTFYYNYDGSPTEPYLEPDDTFLHKAFIFPQAPNRNGYNFTGWKGRTTEQIYYPGNSYTVTSTIGFDFEFDAQWQINTYTVTFNFNYPNDPNTPSNVTRTVDYWTPVNEDFFKQLDLQPYLSYITSNGEIIKEWNINSDGTGTNPEHITADVTFYAQWEFGYKYKLTTVLPQEEPEWSISGNQQITLLNLDGWDNWKEQDNQYIILPKKAGKSIITDYIDILDQFNQSIIEDFEIIDSNIETIVIVKQNGFSPLDDSDQNGKLIIKI